MKITLFSSKTKLVTLLVLCFLISLGSFSINAFAASTSVDWDYSILSPSVTQSIYSTSDSFKLYFGGTKYAGTSNVTIKIYQCTHFTYLGPQNKVFISSVSFTQSGWDNCNKNISLSGSQYNGKYYYIQVTNTASSKGHAFLRNQ